MPIRPAARSTLFKVLSGLRWFYGVATATSWAVVISYVGFLEAKVSDRCDSPPPRGRIDGLLSIRQGRQMAVKSSCRESHG